MRRNTIKHKTNEGINKFRHFLYGSLPARWMSRTSKKMGVPGTKGISLYDVSRYFFHESKKLGLRERAAAVAFNFLMAIPASLIFLITLVPYLPIPEQVHDQIIILMRDVIRDPKVQEYVINFVEDFFHKPQSGLLSVGFVLAIFYSSNAVMVIIRTFDRSLHKKVRRGFLVKRFRAIRLTTVVILLFLGTIFLLMAQGAFLNLLMKWMNIKDSNIGWLIQMLRWVAILALFTYTIGFIYRHAPSIEKKWRLFSTGTLAAVILTLITTFLFTIWVQHFNRFNELYGSIGTTLIVMLLVYINSLILLIGFELNVCIDHLRTKADERLLNDTNGLETGPIIPNLEPQQL